MARYAVAVAVVALLALTASAAAETTHTFSVTLTIGVDRAAHRLSGRVESDAPSEFCDGATVRIMRSLPGKDKVAARVFPNDSAEWRLKAFPAIAGERVYAEALQYHLPSRPVVCLGARSRTVVAP
ncbi:MAG: hypothetical protein ACJ76D_13075 [Solirubrobacterales bacterium]